MTSDVETKPHNEPTQLETEFARVLKQVSRHESKSTAQIETKKTLTQILSSSIGSGVVVWFLARRLLNSRSKQDMQVHGASGKGLE